MTTTNYDSTFISLFLFPSISRWFDRVEERDFENLYGPYIKLRGRLVPNFNKVRYNASLVLGNSYVPLSIANTLPQAYKPIAGYHIDTEVKPLPEVSIALLVLKDKNLQRNILQPYLVYLR